MDCEGRKTTTYCADRVFSLRHGPGPELSECILGREGQRHELLLRGVELDEATIERRIKEMQEQRARLRAPRGRPDAPPRWVWWW